MSKALTVKSPQFGGQKLSMSKAVKGEVKNPLGGGQSPHGAGRTKIYKFGNFKYVVS